MDRESSMHQAYIANMSGHGGMTVLKTEKLNTGKRAQEGKREMIIYYLLT
jgi:hypothetical protein